MRSTALLLTAACLIAPASRSLADEIPTKPRSLDARVARIVTQLISQDHLSRHPLDDEISERAIKTFISSFDRLKLYFLQSDIDEFMQNRDKLDDLLKSREVQFPFTVYKRFRERVDQRSELVQELTQQQFDFTKDEEVTIDPDNAKFAADEQQAEDIWRRRVKYELLLAKADKTDNEEARETIAKRYRNVQRTVHQMTHDDILERFLTSVASAYDPHTSYFSPSTLDDFRIRMGLNYQGIGAELEPSDSGMAVIRRIMPNGGAEKGGQLKPKDRIVSVGQGEEGEMVDVRDKRLDDVIQLIRGKEGTVVRLGVIPKDEEEVKIYSITRSRIELENSGAEGKVLEQGKQDDGAPYRVGMISLPSFYKDMEAAARGDEDYRSTTRDVRKIIDKFKQQQVDAVVLDLRRNGGGSLDEAIGLTGLFIDGPVVQVKDTLGRIRKHDDTEPGMAWDGPLVVLTSRFSASASEILAGAVQDYERGIIIGDETTHGKGTVQSLVDLGRQMLRMNINLGALKITMQQFYRPNGDSTQNKGVVSDIVLPSVTNVIAQGEKDLDFAMKFDQVPAAEFQVHHMVTNEILEPLRNASKARLLDSEHFKKVTEEIGRFESEKKRTSMPLNEEKFLELRKQLRDEQDESEADADPPAEGDKPEDSSQQPGEEPADEKPDEYTSEVLTITVDYIKALTKKG